MTLKVSGLEKIIKEDSAYWSEFINEINGIHSTQIRNQVIVSLCVVGEISQPIIGKIFDITGGRVAQIYKRYKAKNQKQRKTI